ncbi:DUF4247 domain-containing protein [Nocardia sp. XZ_19_385]|uniref:DUF4247 domain-containing protein n=1 Tax=Nocardia sp. XZ_19_385 TaxID=2769488 RepID=UPI001890085A|nr:DUF4247 domain-containing protein [Nocardia sp. XZ_19_385]
MSAGLWIAVLALAAIGFIVAVWLAIRSKRRGRMGVMWGGIAGALVALLVLGGGVIGLVNALNPTEPGPYIAKHYQRAAQLDDRLGGKVYTTGKAVNQVEKAVSKAVKPVATHRGRDNTVYLRYDQWLVVVSAVAGSTKIDLDTYDNGYRRHRSGLADSNWPSSSTASSSNGGNNSGK